MGSAGQAQCKGTPASRMRSAAASEHRTGEDVAQRTLVLGLASAMRRKEAAPKGNSGWKDERYGSERADAPCLSPAPRRGTRGHAHHRRAAAHLSAGKAGRAQPDDMLEAT